MVGEEDVLLSDGSEPESIVTLGNNRETLGNCPKAISKGSSEKVMRLIAQLKCLHTNAHRMGHKQEELETTALSR